MPFVIAEVALAGDLAPPAGVIAPTMKPLDHVEPRIVVNTLPGDATATHVISEPGSYYLIADIEGEAGKDGIAIRSSDVSLDLNGFVLDGNNGNSLHGIEFELGAFPGRGNIRVRNGIVRGWGSDGVDLGLANSTMVRGVLAFDNGLCGIRADTALVRECRSRGNGSVGIDADLCVVHDCVVAGNADRGLSAFFCLVRNCVAVGNSDDGIFGWDCTIANCATESNGGLDPMTQNIIGAGVQIRSCGHLSRVTARFNAHAGIDAEDSPQSPGVEALINDCAAYENALNGIQCGGPSLVRGCSSRLNGQVGILGDLGGFLATQCNVVDNGTHGIRARVDSYVFNNSCMGNGKNDPSSAGINCSGFHNRVQRNFVSGNGVGIQSDGSLQSLIIGNVASGNGIDFIVDTDSASGAVQNFTGGGPINNLTATENIRY